MNSKQLKIFISFFASMVLVLSISHHTLNFWGLEIPQEAAIILLAITLTFPIFLFLNRIQSFIPATQKMRGMLFILPALIISAILSWQFTKAPSIWHTLAIEPARGKSTGNITLYEIKYPPGKVIKFSKTEAAPGWEIEGNTIKTDSANPAQLKYTFFSPVGETTHLLFSGSPESSKITITLDGKKLDVNLQRTNESQIPVEIITAYKLGIPGNVILTVIAIIDFIAFFLLILFVWLIQEISQFTPVERELNEKFWSHQKSLIVLLVLGFAFHVLNFLAVPLIIGPDSHSFLVGAFHWLKYHNFDGVPAARGPAMTALLILPILIFGRNAWGVKATLHLVALACVPVGYSLGWELFRKRSFAFFAGLAFVLMPEMYLFSNIVMSDVPNIFLTLAFCALLLPALRTFSKSNIIASVLIATLATLHRPENIVLLVLAFGFILLKLFWDRVDIRARLQITGVALLLAVLPLLGWSAHNQRVNGFFGLSNYAGAIWYDGWIYFGEASGIHITDTASPSVKAIAEAVNTYNKPIKYIAAPTSLELYPALIQYGYTDEQAMKLFTDAAKDSMRKDLRVTLDLYTLKLKKSFEPEFNTVIATTFSPKRDFKNDYFDTEQPRVTALAEWQKKMYDLLQWLNINIYQPLVSFSIAILFLAVYQKDFFKWMPLIVVALSRLFITITIGLGNWRYVISGVALLFFFTLLAIHILREFLSVTKNVKGSGDL